MQAFCEPLPSVSVLVVSFFAESWMRFELVMLMAAPLGLVSVTPASDTVHLYEPESVSEPSVVEPEST